MNKQFGKMLAVLLATLMLVTLLPLSAFAQSGAEDLPDSPENAPATATDILLTFYEEGGTAYDEVVLESGQTLGDNAPADPAKEGFAFEGWAYEGDGGTVTGVKQDALKVLSFNKDTTFIAAFAEEGEDAPELAPAPEADGEEEAPPEEPEAPPVALEGIKVTPAGAQVKMNQGSIDAFGLLITPANATIKNVEWTPEKDGIVAVDYDPASSRAEITAVGEGEVRINIRVTGVDTAGNEKVLTEYVLVEVLGASYTLTYHSNYPADGMKFIYNNGGGTSGLLPATDTRAEYLIAPGTEVTIDKTMALANYRFAGWQIETESGELVDIADGAVVTMDRNINLYAQWDNRTTNTGETIDVVYKYQGQTDITKATAAYIDTVNKTATFILANVQDTFNTVKNTDFQGWTLSNGSKHYFNATVTAPYEEVRISGRGANARYVKRVSVNAWVEATGRAAAQFFVLKINASAIGNTENYYSVGTGYLDADKTADKLDRNGHYWGSGVVEDHSGNVGDVVLEAPDANTIANLLEITVPEAMSIRWYVVKNQGDGYHVDGVLYLTNKYWNVYYYDTKPGESNYSVVKKMVVRDGDPLPTSAAPNPYSNDNQGAFQYWYDIAESGSAIGNIQHVKRDYYIYAQRRNAYTVTGSIDNGYVTNSNQRVPHNGSSQPMEFTAADGYYIVSVHINGTKQSNPTLTNNNTKYTFGARNNIRDNWHVVVQTQPIEYSVDITIDNKEKFYGDSDPSLTVTVAQAAGSSLDVPASFLAAIEAYLETGGRLSRFNGENVGAYFISYDKTTLAANYPTVKFNSPANGTFTIKPVALTLSAATGGQLAYTGEEQSYPDEAPGYSITSGALKRNDAITGLSAGGSGTEVGEGYPVTFSGTSIRVGGTPVSIVNNKLVGNNNYDITLVPGTFDIVRPSFGDDVEWAVTGKNVTKAYNATEQDNIEDGAVPYTATGLPEGVEIAWNEGQPAGAIVTRRNVDDSSEYTEQTMTAEGLAGGYALTYKGVDVTDLLPPPTVTNGWLKITPAPLNITFSIPENDAWQVNSQSALRWTGFAYDEFLGNDTESSALSTRPSVYISGGGNEKTAWLAGNAPPFTLAAGTTYNVWAEGAVAAYGNYTITYNNANGVPGKGSSPDYPFTPGTGKQGKLFYNANGHNATVPVDTADYDVGQAAPVNTEALTVDRYTFLGWAENEDAATPDFGVGATNQSYTFKAEDLPDGKTLYAVWSYNGHRVTFNQGANGAFASGAKTVFDEIDDGSAWADVITVPEPVANPGYKFVGWDEAFPGTITQDWEFTAQYEIDPRNITLTAASDNSLVFDGTPKTVTGYTRTDGEWLPGGGSIAGLSASGSATDPGTYNGAVTFAAADGITVDGVAATPVYNEAGALTGLTTPHYIITLVPGNITISLPDFIDGYEWSVTGVDVTKAYNAETQNNIDGTNPYTINNLPAADGWALAWNTEDEHPAGAIIERRNVNDTSQPGTQDMTAESLAGSYTLTFKGYDVTELVAAPTVEKNGSFTITPAPLDISFTISPADTWQVNSREAISLSDFTYTGFLNEDAFGNALSTQPAVYIKAGSGGEAAVWANGAPVPVNPLEPATTYNVWAEGAAARYDNYTITYNTANEGTGIGGNPGNPITPTTGGQGMLTYNPNGHTVTVPDAQGPYDEGQAAPVNTAALADEGWTFEGWALDPAGPVDYLADAQDQNYIFAAGDIPNGRTLYAIWAPSFSLGITGHTSQYNGSNIAADGSLKAVSLSGTLASDIIEYSLDGGVTRVAANPSFTEAGTYTVNAYVSRGGVPYDGTLEAQVIITPLDLTLAVGSAEREYTGEALRLDAAAPRFSLTLPAGFSVNTEMLNGILDAFSITDADETGTAAAKPTVSEGDVEISLADGAPVAAGNYELEILPGALSISRAPVILTSQDQSKVYDDAPFSSVVAVAYDAANGTLSESEAAALLAGHTFSTTGTSTERNVGVYDSTYTVGAITRNKDINDASDNFRVTERRGTLTITPRPLVFQANSGSFAYNSLPHTVSGYSAVFTGNGNEGLVEGHEMRNLAASSTRTLPGTQAVTFSTTAIPSVADPSNEGRGDLLNELGNYTLELLPGSLTITGSVPADVPDDDPPDDPPADPPAGPGGPGGPIIDDPETPPEGPDDLIIDEPVPLAPAGLDPEPSEPEVLPDEPAPMANLNAWALLNLIITVLAMVFGLLLLATAFKRNKVKDETDEEKQARMARQAARGEEPEEEERNRKSGIGWRLLSILAGIVAPIVFLLTEDIRLPMVFTDRWTLLMVIILVIQVISMLLLRRARNHQEDEEDQAQEA